MPYLTEASKSALAAAVEEIERHSAAEVVVAVRAQSGSLLAADLIAGCITALGTLSFLLFSRFTFSLGAILFDTALFGVLGALAASRSPWLRYQLTPRGLAKAEAARAARAFFFDEGISETRGRTGILLYVSQTERTAEVLADVGVRDAIDADTWSACVREIERVVAVQRDGLALATALSALREPLARCLPRQADDIDELSNAVVAR